MTRRAGRRLYGCGLLLAVALAPPAAGADQSWRNKPPAQWSQEEALEVLSESPWARTVEVYQPSGRKMGVYQTGERVVLQDTPTSPERLYQPPPIRTELELLLAVYAVRWGSASIIQQALERLEEQSSTLAEAQAPPPELSPGHYVLTARVVQPPAESALDRLGRATVRDEHGRMVEQLSAVGRDFFAGLSEEALRQAASLQISKGLALKPERAVRYGLGTGEGISFFFPRLSGGRPTIPANTDSVEFQFRSESGITLKAKFKLKEMKAGGKLDY
ncbi:MAG: hypothetical protein ACRD4D_04970 [Candidatus Acidiferrales bacterium]